MPLVNTDRSFGWIAIAFHWISAVVIIGMFALGWWMVELTYYDEWYKTAPNIHKSVGLLFAVWMLARLIWRITNRLPPAPDTHAQWERTSAKMAHWLFYLLIFAIVFTGYLISTAKGDPISVFGWFEVPALPPILPKQADLAGDIHWYLALTVVSLAAIHAIAALKHHFLDRDATLRRMLKP